MTIDARFRALGTDFAPGQEVRRTAAAAPPSGAVLPGDPVDFSHGDVDAHAPAPGAFDAFAAGVAAGGAQAYTEYRGAADIRETLAQRLGAFTRAPVDARDGLILTPGTQGALFLAMASVVGAGDRVAVVEPDYFANRKIAAFLGAEIVPVALNHLEVDDRAGIDIDGLEAALRQSARAVVLSNPNNPTGVVYSAAEIARIAELAARHGAAVIVDQLYSRMLYADGAYTHLRATTPDPDNVVTIMGPSKTESLSGYRLGVAFGGARIIERMEKLQAIVSLRAAGYAQAVLRTWFAEPEGWLAGRIRAHQAIRDDLMTVFAGIDGCRLRAPAAGSYLFPELPPLRLRGAEFVAALRAEAGVTVTPGAEFGGNCERGVRLNFSQDHAASVAAAERIAVMVERYRA